jgi:hypothetical protein
MLMTMTREHAFLWALPVLVAVCVALQLYYDRVLVSAWRTIEKRDNEGRFWLFIVAESLLFLILVGQAFFATA